MWQTHFSVFLCNLGGLKPNAIVQISVANLDLNSTYKGPLAGKALIICFFYSAGARDKWSQSPIKETKIKLYNTLYTRKPNENPTSHSENPN